MLLIILIIIIVCVVLGLLWYKSTRGESTEGKSKDITAKNTLTITKDGASTSSTSEAQSGREGYMKMPGSIKPCHTGEPDGETGSAWCDEIGYDKDKHGMAYFYDLGWPSTRDGSFPEDCVVEGDLSRCKEVVACSGGGFDCAFTEEFDASGALIGITNSEGLQLLDVMANDAWDGKWDDWDLVNDELKDLFEWKDGKLLLKRDFRLGSAGTELTLPMVVEGKMPPTMYMIALLGSMKLANEKKPDEIVLQVAGAKEVFDSVVLNPVVIEMPAVMREAPSMTDATNLQFGARQNEAPSTSRPPLEPGSLIEMDMRRP